MAIDAREDLEKKEVDDLLIIFLNWQDRLILARPRKVFRAREFNQSPKVQRHREGVNRLLGKLAAGIDVGGHLSRRVRFGYHKPKAADGGRPDLDLLLNDWGVHHLHLDEADKVSGKFEHGSDDLLFVIIIKDKVYALDVLGHNNWTNQDLIRLVIRNWPKDNIFLPMNGVIGDGISDEELKSIRAKHGNGTLVVDGRCYMPRRGGISTAGTSTQNSVIAMRMLRTIRHWQKDDSELVSQMAAAAAQGGAAWPRRPKIWLRVCPGEYAYEVMFYEEESRVAARVL